MTALQSERPKALDELPRALEPEPVPGKSLEELEEQHRKLQEAIDKELESLRKPLLRWRDLFLLLF